jgi:hypothetical protein
MSPQAITGGRVAAIAVPDEDSEQLVVIIEVKKRGASDEDVMHNFAVVKREVTSAISNSHGLGVADLVLVPPGSIPITTSGKGKTRGVCRTVPARSIRPPGRVAKPRQLQPRRLDLRRRRQADVRDLDEHERHAGEHDVCGDFMRGSSTRPEWL